MTPFFGIPSFLIALGLAAATNGTGSDARSTTVPTADKMTEANITLVTVGFLEKSQLAHALGGDAAGGEVGHAAVGELEADVGDIHLAGENRDAGGGSNPCRSTENDRI